MKEGLKFYHDPKFWKMVLMWLAFAFIVFCGWYFEESWKSFILNI